MIPASGGVHTVFRIRIGVRELVGVRGHVLRGYYAQLRNRRDLASCILDPDGVLNRPVQLNSPRGGSEIILDPGKMMGLRWCRGSFTGRLDYYQTYACPSHGTCHHPAGFPDRARRVARLRFHVR